MYKSFYLKKMSDVVICNVPWIMFYNLLSNQLYENPKVYRI